MMKVEGLVKSELFNKGFHIIGCILGSRLDERWKRVLKRLGGMYR